MIVCRHTMIDNGKQWKGREMKRFFVLIALLCSLGIVAGCDGKAPPMKPGGGGMPQPYNPGNGQYVPGK